MLRVIGDHDPIDVICRHADLEELFLDLLPGTRRHGVQQC